MSASLSAFTPARSPPGRHAAGWLESWAGGHVHDDPGALLHVLRYRLAQPERGFEVEVGRSDSAVVRSVSPGPNAPMVFTSTAGGPTSAAIRSMSLASGVCGVGQLTADTAGEVKQSPLAPVDRHHKAAASGQGDRRRAAKLTRLRRPQSLPVRSCLLLT